MKLVYDDEPQNVLVIAGQEVHGGEEFEAKKADAERLLADPSISVSEVETPSEEGKEA